MALDELKINFITVFKVFGIWRDLAIFFGLFRLMNNLLLWPKEPPRDPRGLTAQDQTNISLCICVSFMTQVNPWWHLLSESLNKSTTEEKSVKPVALTYLTVVCEPNTEGSTSQCLSFSLSLLPRFRFSILSFAALCKSQHGNRKGLNE